jgi:hypothetical protein
MNIEEIGKILIKNPNDISKEESSNIAEFFNTRSLYIQDLKDCASSIQIMLFSQILLKNYQELGLNKDDLKEHKIQERQNILFYKLIQYHDPENQDKQEFKDLCKRFPWFEKISNIFKTEIFLDYDFKKTEKYFIQAIKNSKESDFDSKFGNAFVHIEYSIVKQKIEKEFGNKEISDKSFKKIFDKTYDSLGKFYDRTKQERRLTEAEMLVNYINIRQKVYKKIIYPYATFSKLIQKAYNNPEIYSNEPLPDATKIVGPHVEIIDHMIKQYPLLEKFKKSFDEALFKYDELWCLFNAESNNKEYLDKVAENVFYDLNGQSTKLELEGFESSRYSHNI